VLFSNLCKRCARLALLLVLLTAIGSSLPVLAAVHLRDTDGPGGQKLGQAISALEDVNSDGCDEFLVGAPGDSRPGSEAGKVFFWFGGSAVTEEASRYYNGAAGEWFGYDVAAIGDVNDDGRQDWAAGAPYADAGATEAGRVYIFFGKANPASSGLAALKADVVINGATAGDHFGHSIAAAGDFNGDGKDDLIVGAPHSNLRAARAGAAYIIYGSNSGPSTDLSLATVLTGQGSDDYFGWSVAGVGNFLGHNEDSVAVGAPRNNTHGGLDAGAVYVYEGSLHPALPDTSIDFAAGVSSSSKAHSKYGYAISCAGRWNSDGYDDLVVGAPYCAAGASENGRVEIIYGGTSPDPQGDRYVNGEDAYDHFGFSVACGNDLSGSSADDVLIGAPNNNDGASDSGRAYIYEGGSSTSSAGSLNLLVNDPLNTDSPADDFYGYDVASAGDFDGDGFDDLAVSAPNANLLNNALAGYCRIQDSSEMAVPTFISNWEASWGTAGCIDLLLEADVDPAAVQWIEVTRQMSQNDGILLSEKVIQSGPLGTSASGLYHDLSGFHIADQGPDVALIVAAEVSYSVVFTLNSGSTIVLDGLAGPDGSPEFPLHVSLGSPWPNPCNPGTSLEFSAPSGTEILCRVVDLRGNLVDTLFSGSATGVTQNIFWNGRTAQGRTAASGVYVVQLVSPSSILTRRVVLAK